MKKGNDMLCSFIYDHRQLARLANVGNLANVLLTLPVLIVY